MQTRFNLRSARLAIIAILTFAWPGTFPKALAQDTLFTYQGRLDVEGAPYTGNAEFRPTLWDAPHGGPKVADNAPPTLVIGVTNGLFTLPLDFGASFPGAAASVL